MILTVTLNPSLDRTVELPAPLRRGAVQRADGARQNPLLFHMDAHISAKYGELGQYGRICPSNLFL